MFERCPCGQGYLSKDLDDRGIKNSEDHAQLDHVSPEAHQAMSTASVMPLPLNHTTNESLRTSIAASAITPDIRLLGGMKLPSAREKEREDQERNIIDKSRARAVQVYVVAMGIGLISPLLDNLIVYQFNVHMVIFILILDSWL